MKRSTVVEAIAIAFIILFLYTGISKYLEYDVFVETISTTPLFEQIASSVAVILPAIEIIIAILLFIPRTRLFGLYASLFMMLGFIAYILYILSIDASLPCSCGGIVSKLSWKAHIYLNAFLTLLAGLGIALSHSKSRYGILIPNQKQISNA